MPVIDLLQTPLRELNSQLHKVGPGSNDLHFEVGNPNGSHSVAVGVDQPVTVDDTAMIATSFPEFRGLMEQLGARYGEQA